MRSLSLWIAFHFHVAVTSDGLAVVADRGIVMISEVNTKVLGLNIRCGVWFPAGCKYQKTQDQGGCIPHNINVAKNCEGIVKR